MIHASSDRRGSSDRIVRFQTLGVAGDAAAESEGESAETSPGERLFAVKDCLRSFEATRNKDRFGLWGLGAAGGFRLMLLSLMRRRGQKMFARGWFFARSHVSGETLCAYGISSNMCVGTAPNFLGYDATRTRAPSHRPQCGIF